MTIIRNDSTGVLTTSKMFFRSSTTVSGDSSLQLQCIFAWPSAKKSGTWTDHPNAELQRDCRLSPILLISKSCGQLNAVAAFFLFLCFMENLMWYLRFQKAQPFIDNVEAKITLISDYLKISPDELSFLGDAARELLKARKVLKGSYVYAYYLEDHRVLFEYMQTEMESATELLDNMFSTPYLRTCKEDMTRATRLVRRRRHEFVVAVNKGLIIPETPPSVRKNRKRRMPGLFGMDFDDVVRSISLTWTAAGYFSKVVRSTNLKRTPFPCTDRLFCFKDLSIWTARDLLWEEDVSSAFLTVKILRANSSEPIKIDNWCETEVQHCPFRMLNGDVCGYRQFLFGVKV